jgi:hypothetical protein
MGKSKRNASDVEGKSVHSEGETEKTSAGRALPTLSTEGPRGGRARPERVIDDGLKLACVNC